MGERLRAWSGDGSEADIMGPTVTRTASAKEKEHTPTLKNGGDLRGTGYLIAVGSRSSRFRRKHKQKLPIIIMLIIIVLLLSLAIAMTVLYVKQKKHRPVKICESKECLRSAANLAISMDLSVDPCEDFYKYVCGKWSEEHPRPSAYGSYDWFHLKHGRVQRMLRDFLARNHTGQPPPVHQAADMYTACMDTETLDELEMEPILEALDMLGLPHYPTYLNLTDGFDYSTYNFDWLEAVIKVKVYLGMDVLIGFDIFSDPRNSTIYRLAMGSPETTNPFPSMHNERKRHVSRRSSRFHLPSRRPEDDLIMFHVDNDDEDDSRKLRLYKLYYAEVIKAVFLESKGAKLTQFSETELDTASLQTSSEYVKLTNIFYEMEAGDDNETMSDDDYDYNIPDYTVDELQEETDRIVNLNNGTTSPIWKMYLTGVFNVSEVDISFDEERILVSEPDLKYMAMLAAFLSKSSTVSIELYIWLQVVEVMIVHTTTEMRALHDRYYTLLHRDSGGEEGSNPPRSMQCAGAVNTMLGMAVSYAIADDRFLHTTKPKVEQMIQNIKKSLKNLVKNASWMDKSTKDATFDKVNKMRSLIGFPDWLLEKGKLEEYYKGVMVEPGKHMANMINILQARIRKGLNKFHEPNIFSWATDPTDVNAFHTFQENTITVPLVMMQYPFYDLGLETGKLFNALPTHIFPAKYSLGSFKRDLSGRHGIRNPAFDGMSMRFVRHLMGGSEGHNISLNYGALGTVLGHEITHGFDNIGRQFDQDGNMVPWWSNKTIDSFVNRTECFIKQYSSIYLPEVDEYVNGKHTLSENIADNGGVRESLGAFRLYLKARGPEHKLPGFEHMTDEQLFFLSYGNLWCSAYTSESLKDDLDDVHSPNHVRPRGALQNIEEFARAFRCPVDSTMNPTKRCVIF